MAQLNYPDQMEPAFPGMKHDLRPDYVRSHHNAEAGTEIPFGVFVARGVHPEAAVLPAADGAPLVGITLHSHVYDVPEQMGEIGVKPKNTLNVAANGSVWVRTESAVTPETPVFCRFAAGAGGTQRGAIRGDADTATAFRVRGARFLASANAGGLVPVEFDANTFRSHVG